MLLFGIPLAVVITGIGILDDHYLAKAGSQSRPTPASVYALAAVCSLSQRQRVASECLTIGWGWFILYKNSPMEEQVLWSD